jgi:ABC-2 type transport system ATP-binding protein
MLAIMESRRRSGRLRADMLLEDFGLANRAHETVNRFSGGTAQRLMLARAMMHRPDVLFLDEPTNNLDPQTRLFLWERIRMLRNQGVTIIVTTHDMLEADHLCDRIAIVDHGKILAFDSPAELKKLVPVSTMLELCVRVPVLVPRESKTQTGTLADDTLLRTLSALPGATKVEIVHLPPGEEQADIHTYHLHISNARQLAISTAEAVEQAGLELHDIHLMRPTLEDVFIHITGRELR